MVFGRKKKVVSKPPRIISDDVVIGAAKTIGSAIGMASGAVAIGKDSAAQARNIDTGQLKKTAKEKQAMAADQLGKKAEATKRSPRPGRKRPRNWPLLKRKKRRKQPR